MFPADATLTLDALRRLAAEFDYLSGNGRYTACEFADWIAAEERWRQVSSEERRKAA